MRKIKSWDKVVVISWAYKWNITTVEKVDWVNVYLKWVNVRKKAVKKQWFVEKNLPINISNIALYSDKNEWATKVSIQLKDWKKTRVCKKTWQEYR